MKATYKCEICGFSSQNEDEVQRCEAQGVKSKFSVGEEVEYALDNEKKQWGRAVVDAILFKERTHEIDRYVIKPEREIAFTIPVPTASSPTHQTFVVWARQVDEEELRPIKREEVAFEDERIEAVNSLVRVWIERGDVDKAQEAAQLGRRNLSAEEIDSLIKVCAKKGWLQDAQKAAQLAKRKLTTEEFDLLVAAYIKNGQIDGVQEVVKLGGRKLTAEEADSLVRVCIKDREKHGDALKAIRLGASKETINFLLEIYIRYGYFTEAKELAALLGRELTAEENESIIKSYIKWGSIDFAQETAQRLGRKLTAFEIDSLVRISITQQNNFFNAFKAARLGASRETVEYLVAACIPYGWIGSAQEAAKLTGRELTPEEINSAAKAFLTTGLVYHPPELRKEALKAIELGASKEAIDSLVMACIKNGWINEAQEVAKLAGRELTIEEIKKLREIVPKE